MLTGTKQVNLSENSSQLSPSRLSWLCFISTFALMKRAVFFLMAIVMVSCGQVTDTDTESQLSLKESEPGLTEKIEEAHSKHDFLSNDVVQFDIVLEFGGTERLNGTMTLATNSTAGKIAYKNGKELYYDQDKVFASPQTENTGSARFAAYTWSYFFLFPYKLSDPGTNWSEVSEVNLNGDVYNSQKLTFGAGIGDAPDDWYIAYSDPHTHLLKVAAYIVTAGGTTVEEAEEDPHAISYHDYKDLNGVALARSWKFWEWRKDSGLTRQLGKAELSNFTFLKAENVDLSAPEDFVLIE